MLPGESAGTIPPLPSSGLRVAVSGRSRARIANTPISSPGRQIESSGPWPHLRRFGRPMSRVLVTGASGFVGLPLTRLLAAQGEDVHGLSTRPPGELGTSAVRWHRCDML